MAKLDLDLAIVNEGKTYRPAVKDEIAWETERQGVPGKLTFSVVKDGILNFQEGNPVALRVDGADIFYGFVFSKKRNKDGTISVTAYDQLRYLKNKGILKYTNKTASQVIQMIAADYALRCGQIEDTKLVIPGRIEDGTLFDTIKNALIETMQTTKEIYVLYDTFGALTLQNIGSMRIDMLIDQTAAEDYDYETSIDKNTYNSIMLVYEDNDASARLIYPAEDPASMKRWGVLTYVEKLNDKANGPKKAADLLNYYNRKSRSLTVSKAFGDIRVRGGSSVPVTLDLGDMVANTYMIVDKVKHTLTASSHTMDLTLIGGDFSA